MEFAKTMHQQADLAVMLASTAGGACGGGLQEGLDPFKVRLSRCLSPPLKLTFCFNIVTVDYLDI